MCWVTEAIDHRKIEERMYFQFFGFLKEKNMDTINKGSIE
jgi:hypothetical protein